MSSRIARPLLLAALFCLFFPAQAAPRRAAKIAWQTNMALALKAAKRTGKPIYVDFYTTWCGPCRDLDKITFHNKSAVAESRRWIMVKLDAEKNPGTAAKFDVNAFPTGIILSPDGTMVDGLVGYRDAKTWIKEARAAYILATRGTRI